jgi:hypothetical protein
MNEIHDKTDEENWTNNIQNCESTFEHGDVVIGSGWGNFKSLTVVHVIDLESNLEHVTHRGIFWDETKARVYADTLINNGNLKKPL